jgi:hypothetical protein
MRPGYEDDEEYGDDGDLAGLLSDSLRAPAEPLIHRGQPIVGYNDGEPIPDLARIPREGWRAALAPLRRHTRQLSRATVVTVDDARVAGILVGDLMSDDPAARTFNARPAALPRGGTLARGTGHQVNFRIGPDDYERLQRAAQLYAMRPSTLARALTVRGVNLALHDERRGP